MTGRDPHDWDIPPADLTAFIEALTDFAATIHEAARKHVDTGINQAEQHANGETKP